MAKIVKLNSDEKAVLCGKCREIIIYTDDDVIDEVEYIEGSRHSFRCHDEYIICPECGERVYVKDWNEEIK